MHFFHDRAGRRRWKRTLIFACSIILGILILSLGLGYGLAHRSRGASSSSSSSSSSSTSSSSSSSSSPPLSSEISSFPPSSLTASYATPLSSTPSSPSPSSSSSSSPSSLPQCSIIHTTSVATNPVKLGAKPVFLGNVTSQNTNDVRDTGWQGNIGSTWIITFADTVPCAGAHHYKCAGIEASNSAGVATDSPDQYDDIKVNSKDHAEQFIPRMANESVSGIALWPSAVLQTGENKGIVYYIRLNRTTKNPWVAGTGVAIVDTSGPKPSCTRPSVQWWGRDEPYFGDHGTLVAPDGYIYAYGGSAKNCLNLFLARVRQSAGDDLNAYEYWNGKDFTPSRLYNPTTSQAVLTAGQGSIIYSPFYKKYLYFQIGCLGVACINVHAADRPEGPWSSSIEVWGSGDSPDGYSMYAPSVQPKFSDVDVSHLVLMYTGVSDKISNVLQAINITFT